MSNQAITLNTLKKMKHSGEKITCLTAYDASFAKVLEDAGVEILLVGDSLGMVIQGHDSTLPVSINDMIYHTANVRRGSPNAFIMADMPFMSYANVEQTLKNAGRIMKQGGAQMVKLEGGAPFVERVKQLVDHGIPVCAHLGLMPQTVHKLGGYRVQGRDDNSAQKIADEAQAMQDAGADMLLLECIPAELGKKVTKLLDIPVIGIGAGPDCDAQVLVLQDVLGISQGHHPKFHRNFLEAADSIEAAVAMYVQAVKSGEYPAAEHCY
ncbi:MAG: 3-methyl-2-oxobutanoate hydroxymethyltransferase [Gammaproteobacteria bacterium]|nr:3-methyl-2-oxobutanoate hydroxymethyltransferase [Gammaproteobacteria bacterium]